jgi:hypothetical protein
LSAADVKVAARRVRIDRDVYYTSKVNGGWRIMGVDAPYQLGKNEYFMLGDNSAISRDSRLWDQPAVPADMLVGKPIFIHLPSRAWAPPVLGRVLQAPDFERMRRIR